MVSRAQPCIAFTSSRAQPCVAKESSCAQPYTHGYNHVSVPNMYAACFRRHGLRIVDSVCMLWSEQTILGKRVEGLILKKDIYKCKWGFGEVVRGTKRGGKGGMAFRQTHGRGGGGAKLDSGELSERVGGTGRHTLFNIATYEERLDATARRHITSKRSGKEGCGKLVCENALATHIVRARTYCEQGRG